MSVMGRGSRIVRRLFPVLLLLGPAAVGAALGVAWGTAAVVPASRLIHVNARQFAFDPGTIRVHRGDRVVLVVKSADVTHGLSIDGYDVRAKIPPEQEVRVEFTADRAGRFTMRCTEVCGSFHPFMTGRLVVEPNVLLPGSVGAAVGAAIGALAYAGRSARKAREGEERERKEPAGEEQE